MSIVKGRGVMSTQSQLPWARLAGAQSRGVHVRSAEPDKTPGSGGVFKAAESEEEWLQLDEKVNEYPTSRTFKAIGTGGEVIPIHPR